MPDLEKTSSRPWYHATLVTKLGKRLTNRRHPADSSQIEDLDVLTVISGSRSFAREFMESNGSADKLAALDSPRDLLKYPSATEGVIARVWLALELTARLVNKA
jgi:hypothetical protein